MGIVTWGRECRGIRRDGSVGMAGGEVDYILYIYIRYPIVKVCTGGHYSCHRWPDHLLHNRLLSQSLTTKCTSNMSKTGLG